MSNNTVLRIYMKRFRAVSKRILTSVGLFQGPQIMRTTTNIEEEGTTIIS